MKELLNNEKVIWATMGIIIVLLTQGLKWLFIKPFTKKLTNKKVKTAINTIIVFIAIGLGFLAEYLYSYKYLGRPFDVVEALGWSGAGQVAYALLERILKLFGSDKKVENPFTTEEGKQVLDLTQKITEDGKVDGNDMPYIEEYLKSLENKNKQ